MSIAELVVLVDDDGNPVGSAPKATVHGAETPLHLAFSCYLRRSDGHILLTRRALSKQAWAGVWTNSFCGHPAPGELYADAIRRRGLQELNVEVEDIEVVLPGFRYQATDPSGVVEHEICPVFTARIVGDPDPESSEVVEWSWVTPVALVQSAEHTPFIYSPWLREQLPLLLSVNALADVRSHSTSRNLVNERT